jgi:hypothetical protein
MKGHKLGDLVKQLPDQLAALGMSGCLDAVQHKHDLTQLSSL